jgi:antitoxin ParD1/3/4
MVPRPCQPEGQRRCPMQTMTISLPDPLKQFVDSQVAAGSYRSASEYLGELIRADERLKASDALEAALLEGLHSPEALMDFEDWDAIRGAAQTRLATRDRRV